MYRLSYYISDCSLGYIECPLEEIPKIIKAFDLTVCSISKVIKNELPLSV